LRCRQQKVSKLIFASFFAAAMVAIAFAFSNYRFSKFKFLDFSRIVLYEKLDIFTPKEPEYILLLYSSKKDNAQDLIKKIKTNIPILAIDFAQDVRLSQKKLIVVTGGFNELLKIINKMQISKVPCAVKIKKQKKLIYKQDSSFLIL